MRSDKVIRKRAVSRRVARQVRDMMLAVVRGGTGVTPRVPGVEVAGKTGTAELRPTADGPQDPKNTDAWFVAFAPARAPEGRRRGDARRPGPGRHDRRADRARGAAGGALEARAKRLSVRSALMPWRCSRQTR